MSFDTTTACTASRSHHMLTACLVLLAAGASAACSSSEKGGDRDAAAGHSAVEPSGGVTGTGGRGGTSATGGNKQNAAGGTGEVGGQPATAAGSGSTSVSGGGTDGAGGSGGSSAGTGGTAANGGNGSGTAGTGVGTGAGSGGSSSAGTGSIAANGGSSGAGGSGTAGTEVSTAGTSSGGSATGGIASSGGSSGSGTAETGGVTGSGGAGGSGTGGIASSGGSSGSSTAETGGVTGSGGSGGAGGAGTGGIAGTGGAGSSRIAAWAWAPNSVDSYDAPTEYSYNSSGDSSPIHITRTATGTYTMRFPGLGSTLGGNVQITGHGSLVRRCSVTGWEPDGTELVVSAQCTDTLGVIADSAFVISFIRRTGVDSATPAAYLSYVGSSALPTYSWNSTGGTNVVTKEYKAPTIGRYSASLPGLGGGVRMGTAQVTSLRVGNFCKLVGVTDVGKDKAVEVQCYDSAGTATESNFSLAYSTTDAAGGPSGGYARGTEPTYTWYVPPTEFQHVSVNGTPSKSSVTISRTDTGQYTVQFPDLFPASKSLALVSGFGADTTWCKVFTWSRESGDVRVRCYDRTGVAADAPFEVNYSVVMP